MMVIATLRNTQRNRGFGCLSLSIFACFACVIGLQQFVLREYSTQIADSKIDGLGRTQPARPFRLIRKDHGQQQPTANEHRENLIALPKDTTSTESPIPPLPTQTASPSTQAASPSEKIPIVQPSSTPSSPAVDTKIDSPSASPIGCRKTLCDSATTKEECNSTCSCRWVAERSFCFFVFSGKMLIGPQDPRPVPPVWGGTYDINDLPKPLPPNFAGAPLPHAKGKFAYVTMISPNVPVPDDPWRDCCFGLSLLTSIRHTNPRPDIDIVLTILVSETDYRYRGKPVDDTMAAELIGQGFYDAFKKVGVTKFIVWRQLDVSDKISTGAWTQAFSKLQMWKLTDYEKIIFMDADKLVFRNMDHLFEIDADFAAPGDRTCANFQTPYFPAGGFWVIRPSVKIHDVITSYLEGPDPCGEKWYQGDQILPRLLFTDTTESSGPHNADSPISQGDLLARWDGDVGLFIGHELTHRIGRCATYAKYSTHPSHRVDAVVPIDGSPPYIPPRSTWHMLNDSYDIAIGVCASPDFLDKGNRYAIGVGGWNKLDPFSVHMSCNNDGKPGCLHSPELMSRSAPCLREIYERYYQYLADYDMNVLLAH